MDDSESDCESTGIPTSTTVDLGYVEKVPSWKLESRFFPSKVGSKPAWLSLTKDIPSYDNLVCSVCGKTLVFLCQIYAPIAEIEICFHRTFYIFICTEEGCLKEGPSSGLKVYRCQLARSNNFYPFDPPEEKENWKKEINAETFGINLCTICGIQSRNKCSGCKRVYYCCKDHQVLDWKGGHKKVCKQNIEDAPSGKQLKILFPEYEIVIEPEDLGSSDDEEEKRNAPKIGPDLKGTVPDASIEELSKMAFSEEDKVFTAFKDRVKYSQSQVIRYDREGKPLWISGKNIPSEEDIPICQCCGTKRVFEFQVMPQLLNYLNLDPIQSSIDWGTLVVYTCSTSCESGPSSYREEFIYKQDIDNIKIVDECTNFENIRK